MSVSYPVDTMEWSLKQGFEIEKSIMGSIYKTMLT